MKDYYQVTAEKCILEEVLMKAKQKFENNELNSDCFLAITYIIEEISHEKQNIL